MAPGGQPPPARVRRVGQDFAISTAFLERARSRRARAPALRFGDPRVMALAGAPCALVHAAVGSSIGASVPW